MTDRDIQINIERYIRGELTQNEVDQLWIEFIRDPDLFYYFKTYLHIVHLAKKIAREPSPQRKTLA